MDAASHAARRTSEDASSGGLVPSRGASLAVVVLVVALALQCLRASFPVADHQFGNLLFSRIPIHRARVVKLPQGAGTMKRSAIVARVGPVGGKLVRVVGAHLQNGSTAAARATRLREIRTLRNALGPGPLRRTVLAGDLNSDPGSPEVRALRDLGLVTRQPTEHCTLRTSNENCSDWIFVTPDLDQPAVNVLAFDVFDHRPVTSVVTAVPER